MRFIEADGTQSERVHLLVHILKLVVQPMHSQHEAIASAKLNVDKLESITEEALSAFFNDNELPGNAKKRPFLKELFKVARKEEQFMDGGIGEHPHSPVLLRRASPNPLQTPAPPSTCPTTIK